MFAFAQDYQAQLDAMITQQFSDYTASHPYWTGSFAVLITSPKGDYFATSGAPGGAPLTADTFYRGASTTKIYTAAAIMLLQQQGKLNINDCVTNFMPSTSTPYLPATPDYAIPGEGQITIAQLLEHKAGVFDVANQDFPLSAPVPYAGSNFVEYTTAQKGPSYTFTANDLVGAVAQAGVSNFAPGTKIQYSDTGYTMLGKIIEQVSGTNYAGFMQAQFLNPLGLTNTHFPSLGTDTNLPSPFAVGYSIYDGTNATVATQYNISDGVAEGNVVTTANDLLKWDTLLFSGQAGLDTNSLQWMETNIFTIARAGLGYGHSGARPGYVNDVRYNPTNGVGVLALATVCDFSGTNIPGASVPSGTYDELNQISALQLNAEQVLGYTNVPEPSTYLLLGCGLMAVHCFRHRRTRVRPSFPARG